MPPKVPDHLCLTRDPTTGRVTCDLARSKGTRSGLLAMVSRLELIAPDDRQSAINNINAAFVDLTEAAERT